jgi:hypothetical protein
MNQNVITVAISVPYMSLGIMTDCRVCSLASCIERASPAFEMERLGCNGLGTRRFFCFEITFKLKHTTLKSARIGRIKLLAITIMAGLIACKGHSISD